MLKNNLAVLRTASDDLENKSRDHQRTLTDSTSAVSRNAVESLLAAVQLPGSNELNLRAVANKVHKTPYERQLRSAMNPLPSSTVSTVFRVQLNAVIEDSGTSRGFAKVSAAKSNSTTDNLFPEFELEADLSRVPPKQFREKLNNSLAVKLRNLSLDELSNLIPDNLQITIPALIARQVVSYRLDRRLGTNVLAAEVFSRAHNGAVLGVTAEASGKAMMDNGPPQGFRYFNLAQPEIQRGLADLQIIDAINGQLDRHPGNIFIDRATGRVTGIDNDMAHAMSRVVDEGSNNALVGQFIDDVDGELTYTQSLVAERTAEAIIAMNRDELASLLRGQEDDPQRIDELSIRNTLLRFDAVQKQCLKLKNEGALVKNSGWNNVTYTAALISGTPENQQNAAKEDHTNYLWRAADLYWRASGANDLTVQLPHS